MSERPQKIWRINFWKADPEFAANFTIFAEPSEARMSGSESSFISVRGGDNKGISLSPGIGASVTVQALPQNFKYAGMIVDSPFPLSLIPSTIGTPIPRQMISPPLLNQMPIIKQLAQVSSSFLGL